MTTNGLNLKGIDFASHSKMNVFNECGQKFFYEYIDKSRVRIEKDYFIIGSACHKCIEMYYLDDSGSINHPLDYTDIYWRDWLRSKQLGFLLGDLKVIAAEIAQINKRCRADYTGEDAIRRGAKPEKGEKKYPRGKEYHKNPVADNPAMTGDYKRAMEELDLDRRIHEIDVQLVAKGPEFASVSLSNCYAEVQEILKHYKDPECLASVDYVEFPVSHRVWEGKTVVDVINLVKLPGSDTDLMNGYMDLVGTMTAKYGGGVGLGDYKSSKKECTVLEVMYHAQLNKYAYMYYVLFGVWPTHLFINNLRFGTVTIAPCKPEIAMAIVEQYAADVKASKIAANYRKKDPFGFDSPCLTFEKDGSLKEHCPHLVKCFKHIAEELGVAPKPLADGFGTAEKVVRAEAPIASPTLKDGF
jgi:hypothetical protein